VVNEIQIFTKSNKKAALHNFNSGNVIVE